jgi:hypothetical protein
VSVRITQIPVETSIEPSTGKVRVTQIPVETSVQSSVGAVRVTQLAIETSVLHSPTTGYQPNVCVCT